MGACPGDGSCPLDQPAGAASELPEARLQLPRARLLCPCLRVCEDTVIECIREGRARTLEDVMRETDAGNGCMGCREQIRCFVEQHVTLVAAAERRGAPARLGG